MKPELFETMITAVWGTGDEAGSVNYILKHTKKMTLGQIKTAITNAWKDWYRTDEGKKYVDHNGTNWGDSIYLPIPILMKYGIISFEQGLNTTHTVDHDEVFAYLVDPLEE